MAGYDRTQTPLTEKMAREEGIAVNYADDENEIAEIYRNAENTLVVYTPAIPRDNRQLNFFTDRGMKPHKRSEVLGLLSHAGKALCIAGTHGKTTTSTLLAWLLHNSHVKCSAFLGGISENFGSNLLVDTSSDYIVIEADEFDRSFLTLNPEKRLLPRWTPIIWISTATATALLPRLRILPAGWFPKADCLSKGTGNQEAQG